MQTVDRRLAAILAADVAGYSRLMSTDEEGTIAQLRSHRANVFLPMLETYKGRIANTAGDSFLIEFASAVDALRYAIDVQSDLAKHNQTIAVDKRLEFRIGINVGDVVAEGDDLLGDGVNVAARIEALAEPGGICISRSVSDQVRDRLDVHLQDLGEVQVKNIARPVHVFGVGQSAGLGVASGAGALGTSSKSRFTLVGAVLAAIVAAGVVFWFKPWSQNDQGGVSVENRQNTQPSIAVLPFENRSGDPQQAYFVAGIWEDVTTDLSRVSGLTVASSSSAARFKQKDQSTAELGKALGVNHLLEGSVRRANDKLRISTRLVDANTGKQLWAERFDRDADDLFAIQDQITQRVVSQLSALFASATLASPARTYTPKLEAYDLYIRGRAQRIPPTPKNISAALRSFDKAIEIDPKFAGGYAGAAMVQVLAAFDMQDSGQTYQLQLEKALALAQKAVDLDPQFGPAWGSLAEVRFRQGRFDEAIKAIQTAIERAPSDSLMRANLGRYLGYMRRASEGVEQVKTALRMSPDSLPLLYFLAINFRAQGNYQLAVDTLVEHRKRLGGRILPAPTAQLIAAQVQAEKLEDAKMTARMLLKIAPRFSSALAARTHIYQNEDDMQTFIDLLVQAGIPR